MHIIWLILKIIGILLAVLLGLLLAVLLAVLLVPLRYRLEGRRRQESGEMVLKGRVSWFLSLISIRFGYEKESFFQIRLLGIPWKGIKAKRKTTEAAQGEPPERLGADYGLQKETSSPALLKATSIETAERLDRPEIPVTQKEPERPETGKPEQVFGKIRNILRQLWEKLKGIPNVVSTFKEYLMGAIENLRQKKEKFDLWRIYLGSAEVKATIRLLWRQTKKLFRHLRPQKIRIQGRFGFGDPALTGQATGLMSLLPAFYRKGLSLQPEFGGACLEGEFSLKGRIRGASLLLLALKIWFNKDFQKVYKHLKAM